MEDTSKQEILAAIRELSGTVHEQGTALRELNSTVQEQGGAIRALTGTVQEQGGAIRELSSSVQDVASSVHALAEHMDERFLVVENDVSGMRKDVSALTTDVKTLKNQMVTKNYLDDRLADLRADLIMMARKTNTKISFLIEGLVAEGSLRREVADQLLAMEPFARA